ncbi:MAG TPA: RNA polymerase sigma factor [Chitinophagaceae bacterium]
MSIQEFNSLVLNNAEGLKPFAITLTRDREAAQDLYQETLYKALAHREKYQPGTNVKAWLTTIMRNIFINDYRRSERKKGVMDGVAYREKNSGVHFPAESGLRVREIDKAIHQLPKILKTAYMLYFQGYKYNEIAVTLNEPLGTIKSRIHFARKLLQKQVER